MLTLAAVAFGMPIASALVATLIAFDRLNPAVDTLRAVPRRVNRARVQGSKATTIKASGFKVRGRRSVEAASALSITVALFIIAGLVWLAPAAPWEDA